jgi:hypothetical protein
MFVLSLPRTVKIGDTVDCKINGKAKTVTYRDAKTLVVGDARSIIQISEGDNVRTFVCSEADISAGSTMAPPDDVFSKELLKAMKAYEGKSDD